MNLLRLTIVLCSLFATSAALALQTSLDRIVAIVDESVITERDLSNRIELIKIDFNRASRRLPSEAVLQRQVLEGLISDSLLVQEATRRGIKITDGQLNQTMQRLARQNKMNLSDFRSSLIAEGLDYDKYRETVRRELVVSTLSRQYGQRNATISDAEVDEFIKLSASENTNFEYRLSHILMLRPNRSKLHRLSPAKSCHNSTRVHNSKSWPILFLLEKMHFRVVTWAGARRLRSRACLPRQSSSWNQVVMPDQYAVPVACTSSQ